MKRLMVFLLLAASAAMAQTDRFISSGNTSPYLTLGRSLAWGGQGFQTVGQNFIFNPLDPNQGFCVFIYNNNPTNSHSVTVTVAQSGDPSVTTYQGNLPRWTAVPTTTTFPVSINASSLVGINYKTTASAVVTISFTGNSSAAGSPDTADIFTVQTNQSSCGALALTAVQGPFLQSSSTTGSALFPVVVGGARAPFSANPIISAFAVGIYGGAMQEANGGTGSPWHATTTIGGWDALTCSNSSGTDQRCGIHTFFQGTWGTNQMIPGYAKTSSFLAGSDPNVFTPSTIPSFFIQVSSTNPGAAVAILHHFLQSGFTSMSAWKEVALGCSAACEIQVRRTTAQGTTCTALTIHNANLYGGTRASPATGDVAENACTVQPTFSDVIYDVFLAAGTSQVLDLSGIISTTGTGAGLVIENITALTGTETATLKYTEEPD